MLTQDLASVAAIKAAPLPTSGRALIVDDDDDTRESVADILNSRGWDAAVAATGDAALEAVLASDFEVVMADVRLGAMSGLELCRLINERRPNLPVVLATGYGDKAMVIEALRSGAYDFIEKPYVLEALVASLGRAVKHHRLSGEVHRLRVAGASRGFGELVGDTPGMRRVYDVIGQVASSDASVLVTGESGTGKELVARAIHEQSARSAASMICVNCAAIPASLLEAEFFGHVRGAFTDAKRARPGLFVQASGGTLFLDEIGELPLEMQAKLLRALQEHKARPVGGDEEVSFNARLITATNRDLEEEVAEGRFRADLFYRINVVRIDLPPLRERPGDVLALAQHFIRRHAERTGSGLVVGISKPAAERLLEYDWPGNVREVENCIEHALALGRRSEITIDDLPRTLQRHEPRRLEIAPDAQPEEMLTLDEMERRYIQRVIGSCKGNKTKAARILDLDRRTLYRRLERVDGGTSDELEDHDDQRASRSIQRVERHKTRPVEPVVVQSALLGRPVSPAGARTLVFEREISADDPFLDQHRVGATLMLPAAVGLELMAQAVAVKEGAFSLGDVEIKQPITVAGGERALLRVEVNGDDVRIVTGSGPSERLHYTARRLPRSPLPDPSPPGVGGAMIPYPYPSAPEARPGAVFRGPVFHSVEGVQPGPGGGSARLLVPPVEALVRGSRAADWLLPATLLDGCLQAAGMLEELLFSTLSAPVRFGRVDVAEDASSGGAPILVEIRLKSAGREGLVADLLAVGPRGPLLFVEGYRAQPARLG